MIRQINKQLISSILKKLQGIDQLHHQPSQYGLPKPNVMGTGACFAVTVPLQAQLDLSMSYAGCTAEIHIAMI